MRKIFGVFFIYDGMDYTKVVLNEIRQLKQIMYMFGIDMDDSQQTFTNNPGDLNQEFKINLNKNSTSFGTATLDIQN
jgi:hypothetical protein